MAHSYTPGLRVAESTVITKERRLPLRGQVVVKQGDSLKAEQIVARTELPGNVTPMNAANQLGVLPEEVAGCLIVKPGEKVQKDQVIAEAKAFFGLSKTRLKSPLTGSLEAVSEVTGQLIFRDPPIPVEIDAYIDGKVTEVYAEEGVEMQAQGVFIQGIFGIGGETFGTIQMACKSPEEVLDESKISGDIKGKILVGGSLVTLGALKKAIDGKASAIVVGGFASLDLRKLLGYELGVAITGQEQIGLTLVLTEGFGKIGMAKRTFELLKRHEGQKSSCSGATQIRAGVMRPEIIISQKDVTAHVEARREPGALTTGSVLRVIREPWFGKIGKVTALPPELTKLDTETLVRVLEIEFDNGERAILPRANVEMIEG